MSSLLVENLSEIATPLGTAALAGAAQGRLRRVRDGEILCRDGRIAFVGTASERRALHGELPDVPRLDGRRGTAVPGFVDAHTHLPWSGSRETEFAERLAGRSYQEIAAAGGGILSTVRSTREASPGAILDATLRRLEWMLSCGTTTAEAKSGYGLSLADEQKSLDALAQAAAVVPIAVKRTFLGAHEVPPEYRDRRDEYVRLVCEQMIPALAPLADYCDVFAEPGVFDRGESERILRAALEAGLMLRVHADEIQPMGGAELAVALGAASADHLGRISEEGIKALAASDTVGVLLPGTIFFLGKPHYAPARRMLEAGCAIALATDFNPGSCHTQSMTLIHTIACTQMKMGVAECIVASTINPAFSLQLDHEVGTLHPGKRADLCVLDVPSHEALGYVFGGNPVAMTVVDGVPIVANVAEREPDWFAGGAELDGERDGG